MVCATAAQKPALKGEVAMSDSELTEGLHRGCSFFRQPLSRLSATAPRPGSLLVCATANPKAVPASGESGTKCRKGCGLESPSAINHSPSVTACAVPAPPQAVAPFSTVQAHCTVPYPSRSDRFNGVTGGAGGPKGRNRNLSWPPCKKGYKDAYLLFICLNPSVNS